jgi:acyl-CoA thioester hydrolase
VSAFCWPARVYWEDTDGGGVVYYANYLRFLERARTEWLRALGFSQHSLASEAGIVFTVMSFSIDYLRPARLDDQLLVTCEPRAGRAASLSFEQRVLRGGEALGAGTQSSGTLEACEVLATASVRVACVDAHTFRPQRLPARIASALTAEAS